MRIQLTKNASRNIFYGIMFRLVATLCPFLMRTVLLYTLGVEYLGLNSLFTSLLSFLALTELGIGNAMVYAMYKPIAQDDDEAICSLLKLYKQLYAIIGIVILTIGMILFPFIDYFVEGSYPQEVNLQTLYLIYLANTVMSYFLFGYKQSLLMAFQRNDIISRRALFLRLMMYGIQTLVLIFVRNYYIFILALLLYTLGTNIANSIIVDKMYPQYKCRGEVPKSTKADIKKNVLPLMGNKLSDVVLNSSGNLILSAFLGLSMVAIYDNYYYVFSAVVGVLLIVYQSLTAGLGNSIELDTIDKNYGDFKLLTFMNSWIVTWCSACILCLMQPFMKIWVGSDLMFPLSIAVLFTVYFYIFQTERVVLLYKDAAGLWWPDRFRPYIVMGTNLILAITTVQIIGVYGVILSAIASLLLSFPWSGYILVHGYFRKKMSEYFGLILKYSVIAVIACGLTYGVCSLIHVEGIRGLACKLCVCCIIPNGVILICNLKNPELNKAGMKVRRIAKNIIGK
jgi:Polysaccharide biosynthesis protein.